MAESLDAAFRRVLIDLDVAGAKRLWQTVAPGMPQPENDEEVLITLHLARAKSKTVPRGLRLYSQAWLNERETGRIAYAVGVAVGFPGKELTDRQEDVRDAMSDSAAESHKGGLHLQDDAAEVKTRMLNARAKIHRLKRAVRGHRL